MYTRIYNFFFLFIVNCVSCNISSPENENVLRVVIEIFQETHLKIRTFFFFHISNGLIYPNISLD